MSKFEDFAEGQRVAHITMGDGIVEQVKDEYVVVRFDNHRSRGEYDRRWFQVYPNHLFGRTDAAQTSAQRKE